MTSPIRATLAVLVLFLFSILVLPACTNQILGLMERQVTANLLGDPVGELPDGLHVMVCGAGGPLPSENRSSACLLVVAGRTAMVFDVGAGASRNLTLNGFAPSIVERVFLTHFHSDHLDGLGELATLRWAAGDWQAPLDLHGPTGVEEIAEGFNTVYRQDQIYRMAHHGERVAPKAAKGLRARPFPPPAEGETPVVFERDGVRVTAFSVLHAPVAPAVGYRVEYGGRSIAISGDTSKSTNLEAAARGVDVLFHEALSKRLVGVMNTAATRADNEIMQKVTADILDYHASPVEAAESAAAAGAGALVYYHVVPPLPLSPLERIYLEGTADAFDGPIELSVDGTFVSLPTGSDAIEIEAP